MRGLLFILTLIFTSISHSQSDTKPNIYIDEDNNHIDELTYVNNKLKKIYREYIIEKDSFTIKRLSKLYEFDSLNSLELSQTHYVLKKYLGINNFTRPILIAYRDSLFGYDEIVASKAQRIAHDALDLNPKKYLERRETYDKNQKKCQKFARKNNVTTIYGYSEMLNFTYKPKYYENKKIPDVLKSVFFSNAKRGSIILKPNGQYFFFSFLTEKQIKRMLHSDWTSYIKQYNIVKNVENRYRLDFIDKMNKEYKDDIRKRVMREVNAVKYEKPQYRPRQIMVRGKRPYNCFGFASY